MSVTIPDLWPADIGGEIPLPGTILEAQEATLASRTDGRLQAQVQAVSAGDRVQYQLDLIAPDLNFYRERILTATYNRENPYPVVVASAALVPDGSRLDTDRADLLPSQREASSAAEFILLVQRILGSAQIRARVNSLLARMQNTHATANGTSP